MRKTYYTTIMFTITLGLLMPLYLFERVDAQTSPNLNSSSSTGTRVTSTLSPRSNSSSSTGARVTSTPSSGTAAPPIQLKTTIFADLAKCISARTCHPIMGSQGDDRIEGRHGSNVIIALGGNDIIRGG